PETTAPLGFRSAGIRTILARPAETKAIRSEAWEEGIVRIIGGVRLHATSQGVLSDIETASEQIYYVSMETSARSDQEEANSSLNALLKEVRPSQSNDWRAPILAADAGFRDNYQYRRMLSVHFAGDKRSEGLDALRSSLRQLDIPYTMSPTLSENLMDGQSDLWLPYDIGNSVQLSSEPVRATSYFRTETRETAVSAGRLREIPISFRSDSEHHLGFDRSGTLGLRSLKIEAGPELRDLSLDALGANDLTLVVNRTSMETEYHRRLLTNTLQSVRESGFTNIVPLCEQGRALVPFDSVFEHHRRTSAYQRAAPQIITAAPLNDRDALLKDAKLAWSYFEKWTNSKTGLCPATVHSNGQNSILHKAVTMWDVGSHINALIAAHRLELISSKTFRKAVQKLQPNLAGRRSQGRLLPQGWIVT
ncbi:MAG TPA: DUF3131 domain-containing protein, partial [Phycisphaerales bacterium]|nr:DUF3131 domain-containing protein [Phycisphaerales bacterium]